MSGFLDTLLNAIRRVASGGTLLPARPNLNFVGATVTDNSATNSTDVTIGSGVSVPLSKLEQDGAATGNTLGWTGAQWSGSALNLAGGANYVSGALPIANFAPGAAGQIFVTNSSPATAWTSLISYETTHGRFRSGASGSDRGLLIGPLSSLETFYAGVAVVAAGGTTLDLSNAILFGDTANAFVNAPAGGSLLLDYAGSTRVTINSGATIFSTDIIFDAALSSGTVGTNKSGATLSLSSHTNTATLVLDAGSDVVKINTSEFRFKNGNSPLIDQEVATGGNPGATFTIEAQGGDTGQNGGSLTLRSGVPGSGGGAVAGALELSAGSVLVASHESTNGTIAITRDSGITIAHQVSKATNYTIDSSGAGDEQLWITAAATYTLPNPSTFVGRRLEIIVAYDPTASGGTIARSGSELINGAASNITLGATDKWSVLLVRTNGTDWVIGKAVVAP